VTEYCIVRCIISSSSASLEIFEGMVEEKMRQGWKLGTFGFDGQSPYQSMHRKQSKQRAVKADAKAYGLHVKLTIEQYTSLRAGLSDEMVKTYIAKVNDYCAAKGRQYRDWAAAVRNFARHDGAWKDAPKAVAKCACGEPWKGTEGFCTQCGRDRK
jgi:hypothetical protein